MRKPNILLIMSDEHDPRVTGCYGDPLVRTPTLDGLANRGILFDSCYTSSPLCVPARLSFTAGKYVSRIGAWNNESSLPDNYPSLPGLLNAAGYESILNGKMHYAENCRYGFRELFPAHCNTRIASLKKVRRNVADLSINIDNWSKRCKDFRVGDKSKVIKQDTRVTENGMKFLSERKADDKPFFMLAGYLAPHFPLVVPEEFYKPFEGKVPLPSFPPELIKTLPTNYQHLRRGFGTIDIPEDIVKKGRELYWGFVSWLDNEIGKLLSAMPPDVASNTVVIYTSDHGENKGDHGLWWKNNMYEHSARVPLIVSWPEHWKGGQRRAGVCSLLDVVQTIAELGGAKTPDDWDGDSLSTYLGNGNAPWKDFAVSEYYGHYVVSGITMIRQGKYKYVYHAKPDETCEAERELYDLESDPGEIKNLANNPEEKSRIQQMHAAMVKELGRDPEETEKIYRQPATELSF
jgi:choline-sulfatase